MTGMELAQRIREFRPELPIILATGYAEIARSEVPGLLPRIDKPYRLDKLASLIAAVVEPGAANGGVSPPPRDATEALAGTSAALA
jgi:DNA-binding LytR/AlgR family response regulator